VTGAPHLFPNAGRSLFPQQRTSFDSLFFFFPPSCWVSFLPRGPYSFPPVRACLLRLFQREVVFISQFLFFPPDAAKVVRVLFTRIVEENANRVLCGTAIRNPSFDAFTLSLIVSRQGRGRSPFLLPMEQPDSACRMRRFRQRSRLHNFFSLRVVLRSHRVSFFPIERVGNAYPQSDRPPKTMSIVEVPLPDHIEKGVLTFLLPSLLRQAEGARSYPLLGEDGKQTLGSLHVIPSTESFSVHSTGHVFPASERVPFFSLTPMSLKSYASPPPPFSMQELPSSLMASQEFPLFPICVRRFFRRCVACVVRFFPPPRLVEPRVAQSASPNITMSCPPPLATKPFSPFTDGRPRARTFPTASHGAGTGFSFPPSSKKMRPSLNSSRRR